MQKDFFHYPRCGSVTVSPQETGNMLAVGQRVDPDDVIILFRNNGALGTGMGERPLQREVMVLNIFHIALRAKIIILMCRFAQACIFIAFRHFFANKSINLSSLFIFFSSRGRLNRCEKPSSVSKPFHSSASPTLKTGAPCPSTAGH